MTNTVSEVIARVYLGNVLTHVCNLFHSDCATVADRVATAPSLLIGKSNGPSTRFR